VLGAQIDIMNVRLINCNLAQIGSDQIYSFVTYSVRSDVSTYHASRQIKHEYDFGHLSN
jgi:hypothetical protein